MPIINTSTYRPKGRFNNHHVNTIYPAFFRKVRQVQYERERIETPDNDFLDLDWSCVGSEKLLICLHGLEGSADRPYVKGIARFFNNQGWDAIGLNFRGCSGEPNRQLRSYHIGETEDLRLVIDHALSLGRYRHIGMVGFSLGGNVILKYLGEGGFHPNELVGGVAYSVPCDVKSANTAIDKWHNWHYRRRFMQTLNAKMLEKAERFPGQVDIPKKMPKDFREFDNVFTAPIHGFKDAEDYWQKSSSIHYIPTIKHPALLVSAQDDTFLSADCYPFDLAENHPYFHFEAPKRGGHVGFVTVSRDGYYWTEKRAFDFLNEHLN
ncbi:MAG: alpha/beta fold hydrolase [Phaeodactylibacter sp.]|nr:alpha/beta fold hydrolase [Phaeodactylibacter sp.]